VIMTTLEVKGKDETEMVSHTLITWREHYVVRELLKRAIDMKDLLEKQKLFNLLVKLLSQHEVAEEVVIHSAFMNVANNQAVFDEVIRQETEFQKILLDADSLFGDSDVALERLFNLDDALKSFIDPLENHMAYEEANIFAVLEARLSAEDIVSLSNWYERIKVMAPTRPHPSGPKSAIGNLLAAPLVTFIDKFRDLGKKFPEKYQLPQSGLQTTGM